MWANHVRGRDNARYGSLMSGGLVNYQSGMGLAADKSESAFYWPTRIYSASRLEVLRVESWAARKFIDIPVDDMLVRWRHWDPDFAETMERAERKHQAKTKLGDAMKAGRTYGAAFLVMVTGEDELHMPLVKTRVRRGDLKALHIFNRFDTIVLEREQDFMSPNYQKPLVYRFVDRRNATSYDVHHTRCLRFDGIKPLTVNGWDVYDEDWGISVLVAAVLAIVQEQTIATSTTHLVTEASIPIVKIANARESMASGTNDPDEPTIEQIGNQINMAKSIWRLLILDQGREEFDRVGVTFTGLPDLFDRYARRLAAAADTPATRFWGQSPVGLNATGESDMKNYALMIDARRGEEVADRVMDFDEVLARDAGLRRAPGNRWQPLIEPDREKEARTARIIATAVKTAGEAGAVNFDEERVILSGNDVFGELEGDAPDKGDTLLGELQKTKNPPANAEGSNAGV